VPDHRRSCTAKYRAAPGRVRGEFLTPRLSGGTPASDTLRPGSERAWGVMGLGLARTTLPHMRTHMRNLSSAAISVHHSDREHHHNGCAKRPHDRDRYDSVTVFHCDPRAHCASETLVCSLGNIGRPFWFDGTAQKFFAPVAEPFCGELSYQCVRRRRCPPCLFIISISSPWTAEFSI
jgi:hypothetical protein